MVKPANKFYNLQAFNFFFVSKRYIYLIGFVVENWALD